MLSRSKRVGFESLSCVRELAAVNANGALVNLSSCVPQQLFPVPCVCAHMFPVGAGTAF